MSYISAATVYEGNGEVRVWERGDDGIRRLEKYRAPLYCYLEDPHGEHKSINGVSLTKKVFNSGREYRAFVSEQRALHSTNRDPRTYELLIAPELKVLSEHYYNKPAPDLTVSFIDIEVDYDPKKGFSSPMNPYAPISAISIRHKNNSKTVCIAVPPPGKSIDDIEEDIKQEATLYIVKNESELLLKFIEEIEDSDMLVGWNSDFFDFPYIAKRLQMQFGKEGLSWLTFDHAPLPSFQTRHIRFRDHEMLNVVGRLYCDMLELFKKFEQHPRESYKLDNVAEQSFENFSKIDYEGSLADLYKNDFSTFVRYNIRDTDILDRFEKQYGYVQLANDFYHLSTGLFPAVKGTVKLADLSIINYCHHHAGNVKARDRYIVRKEEGDESQPKEKIAGARVLRPKSGVHRWIGFIDINSLYPSIIQTLNISPETLIGQTIRTGLRVLLNEGTDDEEEELHDSADYIAILSRSAELVTIMFEDGTRETKTGAEWYYWFRERKYAISPFGTIYDQNKMGIIPSVLQDWRDKRAYYKKLQKQADAAGDEEAERRYDRLQYVYKIKLNSLYGAFSNAFFTFYDRRHGESTTGSGRATLRHQGSLVNEMLSGVYSDEGESIVMGDTDSTCFLTGATNLEDARLIADEIAGVVNGDYSRFAQEAFLVQEEFSDKIKCVREIIGSAGIFIEKKHYFVHVVDKEGKTVDDLKVMGVDTKKTIIPRYIAKDINKFVERFLKGESWKAITPEVVDYKNKIKNAPLLDIGIPKGVNKVEDYTLRYKSNPKERLPDHVAGSILWNTLLDAYGDTESPKITSGSRIKKYILVNKYYNKFKVICVPHDIVALPEWFSDACIINRTTQVQKLVDGPMNNIMEVTGELVPTEASMLMNQLIEF